MESSVIPEWATLLPQITRDDVVRSGACFDGVRDWCDKHNILDTAISVSGMPRNEYTERASRLSGYGYGSGYGDGYGDGSGSGYGSGYGYGEQ